jgi:hypothetical protein
VNRLSDPRPASACGSWALLPSSLLNIVGWGRCAETARRNELSSVLAVEADWYLIRKKEGETCGKGRSLCSIFMVRTGVTSWIQ